MFYQKEIILLNNLLARLDYDEKKGTFSLSGKMTYAEHDAFKLAINALEHLSKKND